MSFNWLSYIKLAEELLKKSDESYLRSAISRAYYGVFCIARGRKSNRRYSGADAHWQVINEYMGSRDKNERKMGWLLGILRKQRNIADYDSEASIDRDTAQNMVDTAKVILRIMGINY
jgi:uncharacterized protein (UPF0332 family)